MKKFMVHSSWFIVHRIKKTFIFAFLLTLNTYYLILTTASPAFAQIGLDLSKQGDRGITVGSVTKAEGILGLVFKNSITILFTIGALGFMIMFIWGAVDWILSGGDKEKIAGARKRIVTAITGLVLLALTFVITIIVGQVLGLCTLRNFIFPIPQLISTTNELCKP